MQNYKKINLQSIHLEQQYIPFAPSSEKQEKKETKKETKKPKSFTFRVPKIPCSRRCYPIYDDCSKKKKCCLGVKRSVLAFDLCAKLLPDVCKCNKYDRCEDLSNFSSGSGYAIIRLNVYEDFPTTQIQFYVKYCKLSSRVTSVTLRGPVTNCKHIGRVALTLGLVSAAVNNSLEDYVYGGAYVTCEQTRDILLGRYYIAVRTVNHPECEGEIRGRLHCTELPKCGYNCLGIKVEKPKRKKRRFNLNLAKLLPAQSIQKSKEENNVLVNKIEMKDCYYDERNFV